MGALHVGLTGGIGSGKSTVAQALAALGATVVDADAVSRQCTAPGGAALSAIAAHFGDQYVRSDQGLDRAAMRALVFSHPTARARLESILHPIIQREMAAQADRAAQAPCVVFDIPLLVESGHWRVRLQRVVVVDCLPQTQVARVMRRSGLTASEVQQILQNQASRAQRLAAADIVLYNEGIGLEELHAQTHEIGRQFGL